MSNQENNVADITDIYEQGNYREVIDEVTNTDDEDTNTDTNVELEHDDGYVNEVENVLQLMDSTASVIDYENELETLICEYSRHTLCDSLDISM